MNKSNRQITIRLDWLEISLVVLMAGALAVGAWSWHSSQLPIPSSAVQSATELDTFRVKYGPRHFSEREEEWMIRDYFQDRKGGFFVDVGANHYQAASKSFFLEHELGWSGLAVEPQTQFAADYSRYRPKTQFFPFFVSDKSNETARLYVLSNASLVASSDKSFVERFGKPDKEFDVPTITLTDLLVAERVPHVDFLSMDIELHEPTALRGFDIDRFKPSLVCVEGLLQVRQQILNYFADHRYVIVGKYVWADLENLYFAPVEDLKPASGQ